MNLLLGFTEVESISKEHLLRFSVPMGACEISRGTSTSVLEKLQGIITFAAIKTRRKLKSFNCCDEGA